MTNAQAVELFNLLNSIKMDEGSHLEYAATKTLRKMKEWQLKHVERLNDIDNENCAREKNSKGVEVLLKTTLKRTSKDGASEEFLVNVYTPEGEKARTEQKRKFNEQEAIHFDIHKTSDGATLNLYEKIVLEELGFYSPSEEEKAKFKEE